MMTDSPQGRNNPYQRESSIRLNVDDLPPPETTRPTPQRVPVMNRGLPPATTSPMINRSRRHLGPQPSMSPASQNRNLCNTNNSMNSSGVNVWRNPQPLVQPISVQTQQSLPQRNPVEVDSVVDLRIVMMEQEQEQQQNIERVTMEIAADNEAEMVAVQAQEEEFIRLAMEMSLSESMNSSHNVFNYTDGDDLLTELSESNSIGINDTRKRNISNAMPTVAEVDNRERRNDDLDVGHTSDSSESMEMFDDADGLPRIERSSVPERSQSWNVKSSLQSNNVPSGGIEMSNSTRSVGESTNDSTSQVPHPIHQPIFSSDIDDGQEDDIQIDGREVVLEMARRFLDEEEVELIKDALHRGMLRKSSRSLQVNNERAFPSTQYVEDDALLTLNNNREVPPTALEEDLDKSLQVDHPTTLPVLQKKKNWITSEFESKDCGENEIEPDSPTLIPTKQVSDSSVVDDDKSSELQREAHC